MKLISFPHISSLKAQTLILGSMPGQKSLDENQYYAHPRNAFWKIMASLYGFDIELPYRERCQQLIKNNIALWDVMQSCKRKGSLDSAIEEDSIVSNDFNTFLNEHKQIKKICFNGQKSEKSFRKYVLPDLDNAESYMLISLPSTSPAHASMKLEEKLAVWSKVLS